MILFFSHFATDPSSQAMATFNRVKPTFLLVFKSLMHTYPATVMLSIAISIIFFSAWFLRDCERYHHYETIYSYQDALWLMAITFLTIGYGDYYPIRY